MPYLIDGHNHLTINPQGTIHLSEAWGAFELIKGFLQMDPRHLSSQNINISPIPKDQERRVDLRSGSVKFQSQYVPFYFSQNPSLSHKRMKEVRGYSFGDI